MRTSTVFFAALFLWLVHPEALERPWRALSGREGGAGSEEWVGLRELDQRERLRSIEERRRALEEASRSADRALRALDRRIGALSRRLGAVSAEEVERTLVELRAERDALVREREQLRLLAEQLDSEDAALRARLDLERVRRDRREIERFLRSGRRDPGGLSPTERLLALDRSELP